MRRYPILAACLLIAAACKESNGDITRPSDPQRGLFVTCVSAGANVSCTAFATGRESGNVTSEATWLALGPVVGGFAQPGLFVPTGPGDVGLWARYQDLFSSPPSWFFVNPPETARVLYFLNGVVRDEMTNMGISGVEVRILDGHSAGLLAITNAVGVYSFDFGKILTGETFSIRASQEGYEPSTKTHRVDYPQNVPGAGPPFLDFHLRRHG